MIGTLAATRLYESSKKTRRREIALAQWRTASPAYRTLDDGQDDGKNGGQRSGRTQRQEDKQVTAGSHPLLSRAL